MAPDKTPNRAFLTFLSDLGTRDTYVGQMKGVALSINPDLQLIDLTHEIPTRQILHASYVWADAVPLFTPLTIHIGIVDQAGDAMRLPIAVEIGRYRLVCPDNGLLSVLLRRETLHRAVQLDVKRWWRSTVANTFHGRDILTPVAAAWSTGLDLLELGSPLDSPLVSLPVPELNRGRMSLSGQIVRMDRFGNLVTNIEMKQLPDSAKSIRVEAAGIRIEEFVDCYADGEAGQIIALAGSNGCLEIAIRDGSAADELQMAEGQRVVIRWTETQA